MHLTFPKIGPGLSFMGRLCDIFVNQVFRRKNLVIKMMNVSGRAVSGRQQFVSGA